MILILLTLIQIVSQITLRIVLHDRYDEHVWEGNLRERTQLESLLSPLDRDKTTACKMNGCLSLILRVLLVILWIETKNNISQIKLSYTGLTGKKEKT